MTKTIDTLVEDIYEVVQNSGGWTKVINNTFAEEVSTVLSDRFKPVVHVKGRPKVGTIRMSNIGQPCERKLWYHTRTLQTSYTPSGPDSLRFIYGDILEALLLSLAKAAGHTVEGEQDVMEFKGLKGKRDAVIDGVVVDIKSASSMAFLKFKNESLLYDDPFGYLYQLGSYLIASQDDPLVTDKDNAAFLTINKETGELKLLKINYQETSLKDRIPLFYDKRFAMAANPEMPDRGYSAKPTRDKTGNMQLPTPCTYCDHKVHCWENLRAFQYASKVTYLTEVKKKPQVKEIDLNEPIN